MLQAAALARVLSAAPPSFQLYPIMSFLVCMHVFDYDFTLYGHFNDFLF